MKKLFLASIFAASIFSTAQAAVVVNITEDADAWYASYAGSIDTNGLTILSIGDEGRPGIDYFDGSYFHINVGDRLTSGGVRYEITSSPDLPLEAGQFVRTSASYTDFEGAGPNISLFSDTSGVDYVHLHHHVTQGDDPFFEGYNRWTAPHGRPIGTTLADSFLKEGRYVYGLVNGETITLNIGNSFAQSLPTDPADQTPAPVPLPAGLPLLLSGAVALGTLRRSRRT